MHFPPSFPMRYFKIREKPSLCVFSNLNTEMGKYPPGPPGDQHTRGATWPNMFPSSKLNRYKPAGTDCLKAPALLVDTRRLLLPPGSACKHKHKVQTPKIPFDDADQKAPTTFWCYIKSSCFQDSRGRFNFVSFSLVVELTEQMKRKITCVCFQVVKINNFCVFIF